MKECRVLVFPCGSEIGMELFRSLKDIRFVKLFGASSVEDHGVFAYKNYIGNLPYVTEPSFIEEINKIVDENSIDFIFPAMDSVILALSLEREKLHATLLTSPEEAVEVCRSKAKTYNKLKDAFFLPHVYNSADEVTKFPVLVKPAVSQGAQGVEKVNNIQRLKSLLAERTDEQVICEYLPGAEFTVDCFTDRHGKLCYANPRVRGRIKSGISVNSYTVAMTDELLRIANYINEHIIFRGVWFFQVKYAEDGSLKLLECATRVAGTMCVERARGVNLALLTIMDAMDMDVEIVPQVEHAMVDRSLSNVYRIDLQYKHLYIDFDDTITVHDKINVTAMALLYQCVDKNIPITLLTRHEGDIYKDLKKYYIDKDIFNEIIEVEKGKKKSEYIDSSVEAVFIDDSFAERIDVFRTHGIPSFGTESIDALLDKRA